MNVLELRGLTKIFGGLVAVSDVTLDVKKGSITAIIGPNGAGKTTLFNMVTGVYKPDGGTAELNGKSVIGYKPHIVSQMGISRTFQNIRLFGEITVLENVMVGMHTHLRSGLFGTLVGLPKVRREELKAKRDAFKLLKYFGLEEFYNEKAKNLPYGAQRRLEIARALATKPDLLLLDEPAAGMNPRETADLTELIKKMRDEFDLTVLLIEHDMKLVMKISEQIFVLDHGELIAKGSPEDIRNNDQVIEAYLGKGAVHH